MVVLTTFPPPTEGVRLTLDNTTAHVQGKQMGSGTLYIAESRLSWRGAEAKGFSVEYPAISVHAISRDVSSFPQPCLYIMLDTDLDIHQNGSGPHSSDEEDENNIFEIRFVPENPAALDEMYKVMSECQILHPDANDSGAEDEADDDEEEEEEEDGEEEGYFEGEEGSEHLTAEGRATLENMEGMMEQDDGIVAEEPTIGGLVSSAAPKPGEEPMEEQFADAE